ncbi:MAG: PadR family transcriptional regulator [Defluviitaleaceae bacterium]|nr:PadR family transcriptional regulator [Defluviitaleaceae bacterium]
MSLKHGLLGLLNCEGPTTGYDLDKFFKNSLAHFWQAKSSHIYRELGKMEDEGWLTSERVLQEEKPNKRVYSITPLGKSELLNWLSSPDISLGGGAKSSFLMRIFFAGEAGKEQTIKLLKEYRERAIAYGHELIEVQNMIAAEANIYPKHTTYWRLTALHGEISCKAATEWSTKAIAILEEEQ